MRNVPCTQILVVPLQKISARWTERPLPFSKLIPSTKNLKWEEMFKFWIFPWGTALGLPRNTSHWIAASSPLLAHVLYDSWSLPSSILLCLHRHWRLLQCGWNWRMNASFREEKHRLPDQCSVLLVALKRSKTESQTTHKTAVLRVFTFVVICRFSVLFSWCYHYGQKYTQFFLLCLPRGP